ncbi:hypothetical protein V2A60_001453 [Cordyceps javanica]
MDWDTLDALLQRVVWPAAPSYPPAVPEPGIDSLLWPVQFSESGAADRMGSASDGRSPPPLDLEKAFRLLASLELESDS